YIYIYIEMEQLERIELESQICNELENFIGSSDKVMAEFIINLAEAHPSLPEFNRALIDNGAEFPESLVAHLLTIIEKMNPKNRNKSGSSALKHTSTSTSSTTTKSEWDAQEDNSLKKLVNQFPALKNNKVSNSKDGKDIKEEKSNRDRDGDRARDGDRGRDGERDRDRDKDRDRDRYRDRDDHRDRDRDRDYRDRGDRDRKPVDKEPVIDSIYSGKVTGINDYGFFVQLEGLAGKREGLVHVTQIKNAKIGHPSDVVKRNQVVKVKLLNIVGSRLSLSMKDVDQQTGADLNPVRQPIRSISSLDDDKRSNPSRPMDKRGGAASEPIVEQRRGKRISSPERWEYKQLIAAGVINIKELPNYDEELGLVAEVDDDDKELDIELNEDEPVFLKGTRNNMQQMSPIKIVKNPNGSMQRAAAQSGTLARERKEEKELARNEIMDAIPKDLNLPWEDPMPEPGERHIAQELRALAAPAYEMPEWKKTTMGEHTTYGKVTTRSIKEQRESLPIFALREVFLQAIADNQLLVVIGETGSGKTTQMTQYLAEAGYGTRGRIGCTQPRRVAAMSVAKRVAEEYGCRLGEEVGYAIRFEDCVSNETVIKYMTDGILLRECLLDPDLSQYSVIILDEAHERTISTDVLFGLLKQTILRRPDLKVLITSATLEAEKFCKYFMNSKLFYIQGRMHPVDVRYTKDPESDYLDAALITVMQIHLTEPTGDILLFLTGQEEIDTACQVLYDRMKQLGPSVPDLIILPVYSALPSEMQTKIFDPAPPGARKVVIATNIAETSLTIDGIYYVVDPGFSKQKCFNPKNGMDSLVIAPISQAAAKQRAGRAGRTGPGKCYRLYTLHAYENEMLPTSIPEIQRTNLGNTVLTLKAMGINDLLGFDFMDPPPVQTLVSAMEQLYNLGALDEEGMLTRLGRKMAEFPLEPSQSKMLISSVDFGCSDEIITIVAMLSVQNVFYRPKEKQALADQKKAKFFNAEGDHLTLLNVYEGWKNSKFSNPWCFENYVQARSLKRAQDVRKQLITIMDRYKLDLISCGKNFTKIRKAICSGYFANTAKKDPTEGYKTMVEGQPVFIHPSSCLFNRNPDWVIYHELVMTTKEYMREVISIDPKWLVELAPNFFKMSDPNKLSKRKRKEKIEPLYNKYQDPNAWRPSKRR
ncbi:hypothetical protein SAMD00019534_101410, partial [Acytostelium subglobosum LB1]|uniref:hypothetical protein n=1 Tax=Acytostelium subglobosum LB1 TaxID=1410327 RepID=UPI000644A7E0